MGLLVSEFNHEDLILSLLADGGDEFTSGEALSGKLGLSRTAIWKYVEALRQKGYRIDAVPARGYRLVAAPDRLSSLEISPLLQTREVGQLIRYHEVVSSTNEVAQQLAVDGAVHGTCVISEQQTAGKGRRGRVWVSPPGINLYLSLVLRPELSPQRAPEMTLMAAVALVETLRDSQVDAFIKWPNDVQIDGKKVAGILTELAAEDDRIAHVILGVGVNLNASPNDFPNELQDVATSVYSARGERVPRALFAAALLTRLESWLDVLQEQGFEPIREAWKRYSHTLGRTVMVRTDKHEWIGVAQDIDESGALWVALPDGRQERVLAADVQVLRSRSNE